jgi:hypothetical protein
MEKEFVPYEQALALKELGFDEPCFATIDQTDYLHINGTKKLPRGSMMYDTIDAPTYSQAFRWFREEYNLIGWVNSKTLDDGRVIFIPHGRTIPDTIKNNLIVDVITYFTGESYEQAELECLKKLIEIVKI